VELADRVRHRLTESIDSLSRARDLLPEPAGRAAETLVGALLGGGKMLVCGSGAAGALAAYFATRMIHRFERERPGLPVIDLSGQSGILAAIASDSEFGEVFAKQISAIGHPGDLLLVITTDGNARAALRAAEVAHERQMTVIALTGHDGGALAEILGEGDIELRAPSETPSFVQEVQLGLLHCLCDLVDAQLLGS
jgi:D-sedoheptulose 7-phosphate isomerase